MMIRGCNCILMVQVLENYTKQSYEVNIRGWKLNISIIFIIQSYFKMPKDFRLNSTHFLLWKFGEKKENSTNCIKSFIRYWL